MPNILLNFILLMHLINYNYTRAVAAQMEDSVKELLIFGLTKAPEELQHYLQVTMQIFLEQLLLLMF